MTGLSIMIRLVLWAPVYFGSQAVSILRSPKVRCLWWKHRARLRARSAWRGSLWVLATSPTRRFGVPKSLACPPR